MKNKVEVRSRIAMTGRSSMHIVNEVLSADPRDGIFTRPIKSRSQVFFIPVAQARLIEPHHCVAAHEPEPDPRWSVPYGARCA